MVLIFVLNFDQIKYIDIWNEDIENIECFDLMAPESASEMKTGKRILVLQWE